MAVNISAINAAVKSKNAEQQSEIDHDNKLRELAKTNRTLAYVISMTPTDIVDYIEAYFNSGDRETDILKLQHFKQYLLSSQIKALNRCNQQIDEEETAEALADMEDTDDEQGMEIAYAEELSDETDDDETSDEDDETSDEDDETSDDDDDVTSDYDDDETSDYDEDDDETPDYDEDDETPDYDEDDETSDDDVTSDYDDDDETSDYEDDETSDYDDDDETSDDNDETSEYDNDDDNDDETIEYDEKNDVTEAIDKPTENRTEKANESVNNTVIPPVQTETLQKYIQAITMLKQMVADKDAIIADKDAVIAEKDKQIQILNSNAEQEKVKLQAIISDLQNKVSNSTVDSQVTVVLETEKQTNAALNTLVSTLKETIAANEHTIEQQKQIIAAKDTEIAVMRANIAKMQNAIVVAQKKAIKAETVTAEDDANIQEMLPQGRKVGETHYASESTEETYYIQPSQKTKGNKTVSKTLADTERKKYITTDSQQKAIATQETVQPSSAGEVFVKGWSIVTYLEQNKDNKAACHIDVVSKYYPKKAILKGEGKFYEINKGYLRR